MAGDAQASLVRINCDLGRTRTWASFAVLLASLLAVTSAVAQIKPFGFLPPTLQDLGTEPMSMVSADFNGDGTPDLAVRNSIVAGQACVLVRLGNGDGTFTPGPAWTHLGECGVRLFTADFNNDGRFDLATVDYDRIYLYLGNGDGSFQPRVTRMLAGVPPTELFQMAAGDLNNDGRLDLVVGGRESEGPGGYAAIRVLLGNGDGTFAESLAYSLIVGSLPGVQSIELFDIDGDGNLDALAHFYTVGTQHFLGNGDGTFATPVAVSGAGGNVRAGDFNGDGNLDLAVGRYSSDTTHALRILLGNGDGTFAAPVDYEGGGASGLVVADFDLDGVLDLAFNSSISPAGIDGGHLGVRLGVGDGTFQAQQLVFPVISSPPVGDMVVRDFNGDGRPDIALILNEGATPDHAILINAQSQFTGSPPNISGAFTQTASIVGGAGCEFSSAQVIPLTGHPDSPPTGSQPSNLAFPLGLLDFTITGCTSGASLTIQVDYPFDLQPGVQYWKYGPTSGDPTPHWYPIAHTIVGPRTLQFTIVDGGDGDDDLVANGTIVDAGGPGFLVGPSAQPVPVNGPAGLALLMLLMTAAGAIASRAGATRGR